MGKKDGIEQEFFENGKIKKRYEYKNDTLNGSMVEFFDNGERKAEGNFYSGLPIGPMYYYNEQGQLRLYNEYDAEKNVYYVKKYDSSGVLIKEEGVALSPSMLLNNVINDSITTGSVVDIAFFYAKPEGYTNRLKVKLKNSFTLIKDTICHLAHIKTQFTDPGEVAIVVTSQLFNSDSILVREDSLRKTIVVF